MCLLPPSSRRWVYPVNFHQTTRRNIPEHTHLHSHRHENLKSYLMMQPWAKWSRITATRWYQWPAYISLAHKFCVHDGMCVYRVGKYAYTCRLHCGTARRCEYQLLYALHCTPKLFKEHKNTHRQCKYIFLIFSVLYTRMWKFPTGEECILEITRLQSFLK
jgi:hypothetical protein